MGLGAGGGVAVSLGVVAFGFAGCFGGSAGTNALSNTIEVMPWTRPLGKGVSRRYRKDILHLRSESGFGGL